MQTENAKAIDVAAEKSIFLAVKNIVVRRELPIADGMMMNGKNAQTKLVVMELFINNILENTIFNDTEMLTMQVVVLLLMFFLKSSMVYKRVVLPV